VKTIAQALCSFDKKTTDNRQQASTTFPLFVVSSGRLFSLLAPRAGLTCRACFYFYCAAKACQKPEAGELEGTGHSRLKLKRDCVEHNKKSL